MLLRRQHYSIAGKSSISRAFAPALLASSSIFTASASQSSSSSNQKSHLPLAQISPTVLDLLKSSSSSTTITSESLSQNEQRELALVQRFMKMDQDKRNQALVALCASGAFEVVPFALAAGCDLHQAIDPKTNATPLFHACSRGHWECAQKFLAIAPEMALKEVTSKVEVINNNNNNNENSDLNLDVDDLVEKTNCLIEAVENGHEEIVKLLLEEKSHVLDTFVTSQQQADELMLKAVQAAKGKSLTALLSTENAPVKEFFLNAITNNRYGDSKYTLLWFACMLNSSECVGALLDAQTETHRIDVNATTTPPNVMSALSFACLQGYTEIVRTLLTRCYAVAKFDEETNKIVFTENKNHLNINIRSFSGKASSSSNTEEGEGDTPLMICVSQAAIASQSAALKPKQEQYEAIIKMLLDEPTCELEVVRNKDDDMTPLLTAATRGCENIVSMIIQTYLTKSATEPNKKIDFSFRSKKSQLTPLLGAAYGGSCRVMTDILSCCKSTSENNKYDAELLSATIETTKQNILHLAIANGHSDLVRFIVKDKLFPELETLGQTDLKKSLLEGRTVDYVTPLLYALHKRDLKSVEVLADAGAELEHEGVDLAKVCETEEGMEEFANVLKRASVRKELAKNNKNKKTE